MLPGDGDGLTVAITLVGGHGGTLIVTGVGETLTIMLGGGQICPALEGPTGVGFEGVETTGVDGELGGAGLGGTIMVCFGGG